MNIPRFGQPSEFRQTLFFLAVAWILFLIFSTLDSVMNPGNFQVMKSPHQGTRFENIAPAGPGGR